MGGEKPAKRSPLGSMVRKRLSDISNLQSQPKLAALKENSTQLHDPSGDLINRLLQEKAALLQVVEEREKILELRTMEMQKLQLRCQTLLVQNRTLAQSHSQMFAEVNTARDRLKALQHDVACKDALLKVKSSELEGKQVIEHQVAAPQVREEAKTECLQKANNDKKPSNRGRTRATRSQSMGASTSQADAEKEKAETKRQCVRRRSARFKSPEKEPAENLFEIEDATFVASQSSRMHEDTSEPGSEALEEAAASSHRSSMGRPARRAAVKVQSYKEPSLMQKMRRPE